MLPGVVAGIGGYGNSLGLPNLGGETVFDESYAGNPLVNALGVGTLKVEDLKLAFASGTGNRVVLFGARTGLDGIGGVSVLASDTFVEGAERKLPAVQVGDPFAEKVLIECCLDLYRAGVVVGIQDLGGAGLSCATSELASAGDGGMHINLDNVHLRAENMTAAEILSSESQERMMAVVTPDNLDSFMEICRKWDVIASDLGEVTDGDHLVIEHQGEIVVDAPPRTMAEEGPVYERPVERPADQGTLNEDKGLARPETSQEIRQLILDLAASPALCSREFITEQYDNYVRGNTVLAKNADAGVLRIDEDTNRGIAVATDASGRYTRLDPETGARLALGEAYRNVSVTGSTPVAVSNCLNFGSPEDPGVMWQFKEAVHGLADGCAELGIPVTGGNVSFYNQTGETAILPTPVIAVLGTIDDSSTRIPQKIAKDQGQLDLILAGPKTADELGGSIWQQVAHHDLSGMPPRIDLANEKNLSTALSELRGVVSAASDLSEGGLSQALVELALNSNTGLTVDVAAHLAEGVGRGESAGESPDLDQLFVGLFSETASRVLIAVDPAYREDALQILHRHNVDATVIGNSGTLDEADQPEIVLKAGESTINFNIDELRSAWESTLPTLFG